MSQPPAGLEAFRRLLEATSISSEQQRPILETDALVGPELGPLLRRCAVPHELDRSLLQRLGELDQRTAAERFEAFAELSIMQVGDGALSLHERWRRPLWAWWLRDEQRLEFIALSRTLADWFDSLAKVADSGSQVRQIQSRRRMFHLLGCDTDKGIREFERLCRLARHSWAFSECNLLIRLVKEYEPILNPRQSAVLHYHEGKLASDLKEWELALATFRSVTEEPVADPGVKIKAIVRAAHALRNLGRNQEALKELQRAQEQISLSHDAVDLLWRVLYELGEVYRDLGDLDSAERTLRAALGDARKAKEPADLAGVLNSLAQCRLDSAIQRKRLIPFD